MYIFTIYIHTHLLYFIYIIYRYTYIYYILYINIYAIFNVLQLSYTLKLGFYVYG